jgi:TonB family protein
MLRLILIALLFPLFGNAQDIIRQSDDENIEVFHVFASDRRIRHGMYTRHSVDGKPLEKGMYKGGMKDSIWNYYSYTGDLKMQYDFTNQRVVMYNTSSKAKKLKYAVHDWGQIFEAELDSPPLYLDNINAFLKENLEYPEKAKGKQGTVEISFVVTREGEMRDHKVHKSVDPALDEEALRVAKLIPGKWVPGHFRGQQVEVMYVLPVKFKK